TRRPHCMTGSPGRLPSAACLPAESHGWCATHTARCLQTHSATCFGTHAARCFGTTLQSASRLRRKACSEDSSCKVLGDYAGGCCATLLPGASRLRCRGLAGFAEGALRDFACRRLAGFAAGCAQHAEAPFTLSTLERRSRRAP